MEDTHTITGNKLPEERENPVDRVFLRMSSSLLPWFRSTGHIPNTITTYSFVMGLLAVGALRVGHITLFSVFMVLSYFFDCVDGQFARRYDMVTAFGDWYDHLTDTTIVLLLMVVISQRYHISLMTVFLCGFLLSIPVLSHFGCQQQQVPKATQSSETLDKFRCMCARNKHWPQISRFFGSGTLLVVILVSVWWLEEARRCSSSAAPHEGAQ